MLRIAALTNIGKCREVNEDAVAVVDLATGWAASGGNVETSLQSRAVVIGVYDGTGSAGPEMAASHVAARMVCEHMLAPPRPEGGDALARRLDQALRAAAREIVADNERTRRGFGSTATVAVIAGPEVVIANVGDSRGYLFAGNALKQVTRDDTIENLLRDDGRLSAAEIENHPHRTVVTRVLGYPHGEEPAITKLTLQAGDMLLLCTDGISGMLHDPEIAAILRAQRTPEGACRSLVDAAEDAGGYDSESAVVAVLDSE
ncbi:MAG TPA: protein phosphatase 2C domain-containing protein [Polyangia bacterium]|nr:protein phosphatase 2C domain-containing protein [Polyangia bacterium]